MPRRRRRHELLEDVVVGLHTLEQLLEPSALAGEALHLLHLGAQRSDEGLVVAGGGALRRLEPGRVGDEGLRRERRQ